MPELRTRVMPILAQDTGVRHNGKILTARVSVPWEDAAAGPAGYRVHVVDYDASTDTLYRAATLDGGDVPDPKNDAEITTDPEFHARNAYALVLRTLARFEFSLGRRVAWGFRAHQIKVVPHAFEEMNAFYSPAAESLLFGYYRAPGRVVFTSLSHDVVVHETTHALLDGLRSRFMSPSSADQAAFHEGYADVIALLSVFSLPEVLGMLLDANPGQAPAPTGLIRRDAVSMERLMRSVLLGLAEEMGADSGNARVNALRRSVEIEPAASLLDTPEYREPHRRGEILVAATMRAFLEAWTDRLTAIGPGGDYLDVGRVIEEGAAAADLLLTMSIRAIDYTPPIHLEFGDFLSALLTADSTLRNDDSRYRFRERILKWFGRYGIEPASKTDDGVWEPSNEQLVNEGVRFGSLQTDPIEMFRLIWSNRKHLKLDPTAYTRVASVRPSIRTSPDDGFALRETVAECLQYVAIPAAHLGLYGLVKPLGMPDDMKVELEGGSTLILDEYGKLKYEIHNRLPGGKQGDESGRAQKRLDYLWEHGELPRRSSDDRLAELHRLRMGQIELQPRELW
ncbi:MAG: hypothetical protein M3540_00025 [Actinomycetota bacterium]|nr:hypothetical protein [Actinomycetota bacterium]